ncbi:MAG: EAL domain-containing protein [Lysobacter sp.]|nr:MAG: EAL domain-containing protein [Lysobacter sp.]
MNPRSIRSASTVDPAVAPPRRMPALARQLRAPLLVGLVVALAILAAWRWLPPMLAFAAWGVVAGAWAGLWNARALPGRFDPRWLAVAAGIAAGAAAARRDAIEAAVAMTAMTAVVIGLREVSRRRQPLHEWDDPAMFMPVLALLAALAGPLALLALQAPWPVPMPWTTAWSAVALGAVAAYPCAATLAAADDIDPFATDPQRATLLFAATVALGGAALAIWAPRMVPLLALAILAFAAAGRPRIVALLGAFLAFAAVSIASLRPLLLARMFGGWTPPAVFTLLACVIAIATVGSLLVHQRDRVRSRLRAATGHLFTLTEKAPGLVATCDRDHRHRHVNEVYAKWAGVAREQLEGMPLSAVLGLDADRMLATSIQRVLAGASQRLQVEARGDRILDVRLEPHFGLDGAIAGFHLLADDVTWRGQSERDLRTMIAAAPDPTLVLDESGRIQLHNIPVMDLLGAQTADLVGTPLTAWLVEKPPAAAVQHEGAAPEMRARRHDGTSFPVELRLGSMPGEHGGRAVVSLRDLSAQHALEAAARHAREQAQATLDSIGDALVVVDTAGTITAFNPAAAELTGWLPEEAVGRELEEVIRLIEPAKGLPRPSVLRSVLHTGQPARLEGELELVRRDGAHRPIEESASPLRDGEGRAIGGVLMFHDVTHVREQAQALSHMAQHDFLTGLPNRVLFQDRLTQALAQMGQGGRGAVLYMDLDRFKPINDTLGHPIGDKVLQEVATRLCECVRADDTVSRQGGDEFVVLLVRLADPRDAARVAEKLIRLIEQPMFIDGHELQVSASVGISLYPQDGRDVRTLMKQADTALYHVKESGRGRYSYFTDLMGERADARMRTEHDLRLALMSEDFVLDYQPVVDARDGQFNAVEALLRWRRMDGSILLPEMFLPVAEETGLILQIDEWVMRKACLQNAAWQQAGLPHWPVSVNVSLARFDPDRLLAQVDDSLGESNLEPQWLEIEFRGEQLFPLGEKGRDLVADLRAMGVKVAVDDVATSQASVSQLADFGFDALKLDLDVVGALPDDERARRIAEAICRAGVALGCPVIAKGVETEAHRELLVGWGCSGLQGTLFSPPMASDLLPGMLDPSQPGSLARRA